MGLLDAIVNLFRDVVNAVTPSAEDDLSCSMCINCKPCLKYLSDGRAVRIFTCPAFEADHCEKKTIQQQLPQDFRDMKYKEAYNKIRNDIDNHINTPNSVNSKPITFVGTNIPILNQTDLHSYRQCFECSHFRPYMNYSGNFVYNPFLINSVDSGIYFDNLSKEDKVKITGDNSFNG